MILYMHIILENKLVLYYTGPGTLLNKNVQAYNILFAIFFPTESGIINARIWIMKLFTYISRLSFS